MRIGSSRLLGFAYSGTAVWRRSLSPLKMAAWPSWPGSAQGVGTKPLFSPSVALPTWEELGQQLTQSDVGRELDECKRLWADGAGPPHTDALLRLFGTKGEPRVTLFRDTAAWCPYCQKTAMLLEEKEIPYIVKKINMRAYGEKPEWFLKLVPNGLLPAISIDGRLVTESSVIMTLLDRTFTGEKHRPMLPKPNTEAAKRAEKLFRLERELFGWWCQVVFRPSGASARGALEATLDEVNSALGAAEGPWFLAPNDVSDGPSMVDLVFCSHLERMAASLPYWRGLRVRGNPKWPNINRWFDALERRPTYRALQSDYYTHVTDIPPQYGDGFSSSDAETAAAAAAISGSDGSWSLPLKPLNGEGAERGFDGLGPIEIVLPENDPGPEKSARYAALKLVRNHANVVRFACRGAGSGSGWGNRPGRAQLSDPFATPNEALVEDLDVVLRAVAVSMLEYDTSRAQAALNDALALRSDKNNAVARISGVVKSVEYLRDRVGVPRDMSYPAARQFRAHLNWARVTVLSAAN